MKYTIADKIQGIESRIRQLNIRVEKAELREKQLIIMFKQILQLALKAKRSNKHVSIEDILKYMETLVYKNMSSEELQLNTESEFDEVKSRKKSEDFISDMIKNFKG